MTYWADTGDGSSSGQGSIMNDRRGQPTARRLRNALVKALDELERLHYLFGDEFEGKCGEPDKAIIRHGRKVLTGENYTVRKPRRYGNW
jgi:hypothetical protein